MIHTNYKNNSLEQDAAEGLISLFQQGSVVLIFFVAMFLFTSGTPSGFGVGLTVGLSSIFVTWSEQHRFTLKNKTSNQQHNSLTSLERINGGEPLTKVPFKQKRLRNNRKLLIHVLFGNGSDNLTQEDWTLPSYLSAKEIQTWLKHLESERISPNKLAVLRRKLADFSSDINATAELQTLIMAITESKNDFVLLAQIAALNPLLDFANCDLRSLDLSNAKLGEANLCNTNLNYANLSRADLPLVNLNKAALNRANLRETILFLANLSGAILDEANLSDAYLIGANLSGAYLSEANLIGANLSEANLSEANLIGANLSKANLSEANLIGANLSEANLSEANVENTRFSFGKGISLDLKLDLQRRGAIFDDFSGDLSRILVHH